MEEDPVVGPEAHGGLNALGRGGNRDAEQCGKAGAESMLAPGIIHITCVDPAGAKPLRLENPIPVRLDRRRARSVVADARRDRRAGGMVTAMGPRCRIAARPKASEGWPSWPPIRRGAAPSRGGRLMARRVRSHAASRCWPGTGRPGRPAGRRKAPLDHRACGLRTSNASASRRAWARADWRSTPVSSAERPWPICTNSWSTWPLTFRFAWTRRLRS